MERSISIQHILPQELDVDTIDILQSLTLQTGYMAMTLREILDDRAWTMNDPSYAHDGEVVIARIPGGEIIGWGLAYTGLSQHGDITRMFQVFVKPNHRRRGVGRELMKAVQHIDRDQMEMLLHDDIATAFYNNALVAESV